MADQTGGSGRDNLERDNLLPDDLIQSLVFETFGLRRFTQDSPINADIWVRFLKLARLRFLNPEKYNGIINSYRIPLILTPKHTQEDDGTPAGHAGMLARKIRQRCTGKEEPGPEDLKSIDYLRIAATSRHVAIDATFFDLIHRLLPLSDWWRRLPDFTLGKEQQKVAAELRKTASIPQVLYQLTNTEAYRFAALATITHSFLTKARDDLKMDEIIRVLAPNYLASNTERLEEELFGARRDADITAVRDKNVALFNWLFENFSEIRKEIDATSLDKAVKERLDREEFASIWKIHLNRQAFRQDETIEGATKAGKAARADNSSIVTVKADAARRLFNIKTSHLCWAVIDTGIDARHAVFRDPADNSKSRIVASLDFTLLQDILSGKEDALQTFAKRYAETHDIKEADARRKVNELSDNLHDFTRKGYQIDWGLVEQLIRIDPEKVPPSDPHGTHVAGIIAGHLPEPAHASGNGDDHNARKSEYREAVDRFGPFAGVCPDIRLYDLRVIKDPVSGDTQDTSSVRGDEFVILAALDYVAWKNGDPMRPVIHGVNISLAIPYAVGAHACGHTPVCDACDRLVWNGTVVVAAAGNSGFDENNFQSGLGIGYRDISITDPGNANEVITVGSTHYCEPHTYGVSYFSGRGPTGDGRMKPDLVAPGHKIWSAVPGNEMVVLDGTSMATPHVSGICALIMGRHQELTGEPERIKKILMDTATDLGREQRFQGAGLVDALRALQAV